MSNDSNENPNALDEDLEWEFEYQGRSVRRGAGGRGWLIVRTRGVAGALIGEEDTQLEFSSFDALKQYIDTAAEDP